MDLFKRIQDLSAIYDDDGPSSTVLESRPMFANGQLVQPNADGSRPGYSGEYGPNIRKKKNQDLLEVTLNRGNETYYDSFSYGDGNRPGPKPKYPNKKAALEAANKFRDSVKNLPKKTGTVMTEKRLELAAKRKGTLSETGKKAEIRNALKDIIKVGGKSFSNEDLRKLVDMSLFDTDDYFRKTVDVVKKEPAFENLTFEKKPRVRLKNDPVSVLQAEASKRRKKKIDILGSKEYEKELYKYKKEIQEGLGLEKYKTSGSISGKPKEILPIEMGHQSSIKQLSLLKQKMRPEDLSPQNYEANRKGVKKYEGGVQTLENNLNKKFYPTQKKLYIQAKKFIDAGQEVPADLQNKIVSLNEDIQKFVNKTVEEYPLLKDRVNPITIDANDLTVRRGDNVFKQLGIGLVDQDLGDIKIGSVDDLTIKANLAEQTLKEAVDAGLIDEVEGRKKLDIFLNAKPIENIKDLKQDFLKLAGTVNPKCRKASVDGGRIGLSEGLSSDFCINEGKKVARNLVEKNIKGSPAQNSIIKRLTGSLTNFVKSTLDPKELFDIKKQLFSKGAVASLPIFDAGIAAYEAAAMGKPIKEAISNTLTFGSIPRAMGAGMDTPDVLNAKQLLKDPNLSPAGKEYAQLIIDSGNYEQMQSDTTGGMTKKFNDFKEIQNKIKNASTAGRFDYESRLNEIEGAEMAKDDYSPIFGSLGDPLKNRAINSGPKTRGGRGAAKDYKIDLSPVTYQNFKPDYGFTKEQFENAMRKEGSLADDQVYQDAFYKQEVEKPIEFQQLMELPSFRGASEKFAGGGIAKMAGDRSGAMTRSMNPDSQGLSYLFNRVKKV